MAHEQQIFENGRIDNHNTSQDSDEPRLNTMPSAIDLNKFAKNKGVHSLNTSSMQELETINHGGERISDYKLNYVKPVKTVH